MTVRDIIDRRRWGARPAGAYAPIRATQPPTIHWNGPATGLTESSSVDAEAAFLRGVQSHHIDTNHWIDIAYSWAFAQTGRIYECRGWGNRSAANGTRTGNDSSHAFFLMLGQGEQPSDAMIAAIREMRSVDGHDTVRPHRSWKPTECPGDDIARMIDAGIFNANQETTMPTPNDYVRQLQERLGVEADGLYGPITHRAVMAALDRPSVDPADVIDAGHWRDLKTNLGIG